MDKIIINGVEHEWPHDDALSYEKICELAGDPPWASVTYHGKRVGDAQRSGILHRGETVQTDDGLRISCIVTGNA